MLNYLTAGESHGPQLTSIIDGLPAGLKLDIDALNYQLERRQKGFGRGGRMKIERDTAQFVGGVRHGLTMGGPVAMVIENRDWTNWTGIMHPVHPLASKLTSRQEKLARDTSRPRPGHADLAGAIKYDHHDMRNVLERASARETAARVALGAVCRQLLEHFGVGFASHVVRIGKAALPTSHRLPDLTRIAEITEASPVRCLDKAIEDKMIAEIKAAGQDSDSLGGIAEVIVAGLPVGLGSYTQWSRRLDGRLSGALGSIPSVKGVEIGLGFKAARRRGSTVHDEIFSDPNGVQSKRGFNRRTNNAGGLEGGITNGEPLVARVIGKPISTLNRPLRTVDVKTREPAVAIVERTDVCVTPALAVVCEAVVALILADAFLEKFGCDNMTEVERHWQSWLSAPF